MTSFAAYLPTLVDAGLQALVLETAGGSRGGADLRAMVEHARRMRTLMAYVPRAASPLPLWESGGVHLKPTLLRAAGRGMPTPTRLGQAQATAARALADEIRAHAKEQLAAYKYPRSVEVVGDLPKTVTGKILRRELRDQG